MEGAAREKFSGATLTEYPFSILMGTLWFMGLRSIAFLLTAITFTPLSWEIYKSLTSGFEASALQVLNPHLFILFLFIFICGYLRRDRWERPVCID
jgi:hypothetical protein